MTLFPRQTLPLALLLLTACSEIDDSTNTLVDTDGTASEAPILIELEATAYDVCAIDVSNHLHCADKYGLSWNMADLALGSNQYIELDANQTHLCALEDNDGDGAGDIHCFKLENLHLLGAFDVHAGPYTSFSFSGGQPCGVQLDGSVVCPEAEAGSGIDSPPVGSFENLWTVQNSLMTGVCARASDGVLTCFGDEGFEEQIAECPLPTADVVDMDVGGYPFAIALTSDGQLSGWSNIGCVSEAAPGAGLVETGQNVVCTLDDLGAIACIDLNVDPGSSEVDDDSILENAPAGSFEQLAGNPNNVGQFMCASAGPAITCWGDGWNDGVPQTFDFAD
jgi:hypothetical protein